MALTFDDGPGSSTAAITTILRTYGVTATFFNQGVNMAARPTDVGTEQAAGFVLGNHTWSHADLSTLPASGQATQIDQATAEQQALVGLSPCVFRPPYGNYNTDTLNLAYQRHLSVWLWSVDTLDWQQGTSTSPTAVQSIISRAEQGISQSHPVILMHNQAPGTPAATPLALPAIINFYRQRGYAFVNLSGGSSSGLVSDVRATEATNADGRPELFAISAGGPLVHNWWTGSGWWGFVTLVNGYFAGRVAVLRNATGRLEVFARNTNGAMIHTWQLSTGGWSSPAAVGGSPVATDPIALAWPGNREEVFAANAFGRVVGSYRLPNGVWTSWVDMGGSTLGAPAIGLNQNGTPDLFTVSRTGALAHAWWTHTGWIGWFSLAPGSFTGTATVVTNSTGTLEVFVRMGPNLIHLWQFQANGVGGWSPPYAIGGGGPFASDAAAVLWPDGHAEAFTVTATGAVVHSYRMSNGSWSAWFTLGANVTASVTAWSWQPAPGRVDVAARLPGGSIADTFNAGSGFSRWAQLGGSFGGP